MRSEEGVSFLGNSYFPCEHQLLSRQQVLIQYDLRKRNSELALDYGFTESRAARNIYTLTLRISEADAFFGDQLDIAESNGLGEVADFDFILGESLPPALLTY
ncbi:hypothetical protein ACHQM5_021212 [Ranunculus cassubicifolius]